MNNWDKGYQYALSSLPRKTIPKALNTTRFRLGYQAGIDALKRKRLENLLLQKPKQDMPFNTGGYK